MKYRLDPKSGNKLSQLGLGCMRFPKSDAETEKILLRAIEGGINYFDTAYIYGDSEARLGKILAAHDLRKKIYIATKLPLIMLRKPEDIERYFQTELARLKTDYIDYYLLHMLPDVAYMNKLREWGIEKWLSEKKAAGAIRHVGFSFHGTNQAFTELLEDYPWEFCLIQYNYVDEFNQAGVKGLKLAAEKGLPVMIMEPLLGGRLATSLPEAALKLIKAYDEQLTPAAFGLNWLWNQKEPTVVLSGMSSLTQLEENLALADKAEPEMLTKEDIDLYEAVKAAFVAADKIHCTGCNYCMPCPKNVNIPCCFKSYNMSYSQSYYAGLHNYMKEAGLTSTTISAASNCIGCGKCERHCPQHIEIRKELKKVEKRLEPFWIKLGYKAARKVLKRGS